MEINLVPVTNYDCEFVYHQKLYKSWKLFSIEKDVSFYDGGMELNFHKWLLYDTDNDWLGCISNHRLFFYQSKEQLSSLTHSGILYKQDSNFLFLLMLICLYTIGASTQDIKRKLVSCEIPPTYRLLQNNQFLYRVLFLEEQQTKENPIILQPTICSSWSLDRNFCQHFVNDSINPLTLKRVILKCPVAEAKIVINLAHSDFACLNSFSFQQEVILLGTGIPENKVTEHHMSYIQS